MPRNQSVSTENNDLTKREKASRQYIGSKSVVLIGQTHTGNEIAQMCAKEITAEEFVESTLTAYRKAVAARDVLHAAQAPTFAALKSHVQASYGKSSPTVAEFGYKPAAEAVTSVEVKAAAVVKLRATRSARHTMGSKQRKSIKGAAPSTPMLVPSPRTAASS